MTISIVYTDNSREILSVTAINYNKEEGIILLNAVAAASNTKDIKNKVDYNIKIKINNDIKKIFLYENGVSIAIYNSDFPDF